MVKSNYYKHKIKDELKKYDLYTSDIIRINYHLSICSCTVEEVIFKLRKNGFMTFDENNKEEEIINNLYNLILKCDDSSKEFDRDINDEMTRIGFKIEQYSSSGASGILYEDDRATDALDNMNDNFNLLMHIK